MKTEELKSQELEIDVKEVSSEKPAVKRGNPIDVHVGLKMRQQRIIMGLSQSELGRLLNITFQQVQKYERGINRVSASRLVDIANVLGVSLNFFFSDIPDYIIKKQSPRMQSQQNSGNSDSLSEPFVPEISYDPNMTKRETLELVRAYYKIKKPRHRRTVMDLCRSLAGESSKDDK